MKFLLRLHSLSVFANLPNKAMCQLYISATWLALLLFFWKQFRWNIWGVCLSFLVIMNPWPSHLPADVWKCTLTIRISFCSNRYLEMCFSTQNAIISIRVSIQMLVQFHKEGFDFSYLEPQIGLTAGTLVNILTVCKFIN